MAKRKAIEIRYDKPSEDIPALPSRYSFCLVAGEWRQLLGRYQLQLMVAEALNYCVHREKMHIEGYLITPRAVYLVLRISKAEIHQLLDVFFERIEIQVDHHLNHIRGQHPENIIKMQPLFRLHNLVNFNLIKMITGEDVVLPYYNAAVEKLKDIVSCSEFCSAIDYSGAKGPVVMKMHNYLEKGIVNESV